MKYYIVIKAERCRVNGTYYDHPTFDRRKTKDWEKLAKTRNVIFVGDLETGEVILNKENSDYDVKVLERLANKK